MLVCPLHVPLAFLRILHCQDVVSAVWLHWWRLIELERECGAGVERHGPDPSSVVCGEAARISNADRVLHYWTVATREEYLLWSKERRRQSEGEWGEPHTGRSVC